MFIFKVQNWATVLYKLAVVEKHLVSLSIKNVTSGCGLTFKYAPALYTWHGIYRGQWRGRLLSHLLALPWPTFSVELENRLCSFVYTGLSMQLENWLPAGFQVVCTVGVTSQALCKLRLSWQAWSQMHMLFTSSLFMPWHSNRSDMVTGCFQMIHYS